MSMPQGNTVDAQPDTRPTGKGQHDAADMVDTITLKSLLKSATGVSRDLIDHGKFIATDYMCEMDAEERQYDIKDRSRLACRAHSAKDSDTVYLQWMKAWWVKKAGYKDRKTYFEYLKKPSRGWSYNISVLMKHAHESALDRVQRTEYKFTALRKINYHLARIRFHLRESIKAEVVLEEGRITVGRLDEAPVVENLTLTSLLEDTLAVSDDLLAWVENFASEYQTAIKAKEKRLDFKDRSNLMCRAVRKTDSLPVYVEWSSIRWERGDDGKAKPFFAHIRKPTRGFSYNLTTLKKYVHGDSTYLVEEAERKFAALRKINYHLARIRFHLREALKAESILDGKTPVTAECVQFMMS